MTINQYRKDVLGLGPLPGGDVSLPSDVPLSSETYQDAKTYFTVQEQFQPGCWADLMPSGDAERTYEETCRYANERAARDHKPLRVVRRTITVTETPLLSLVPEVKIVATRLNDEPSQA